MWCDLHNGLIDDTSRPRDRFSLTQQQKLWRRRPWVMNAAICEQIRMLTAGGVERRVNSAVSGWRAVKIERTEQTIMMMMMMMMIISYMWFHGNQKRLMQYCISLHAFHSFIHSFICIRPMVHSTYNTSKIAPAHTQRTLYVLSSNSSFKIRNDENILTCTWKLTRSQLNPSHRTKQRINEWKN